jgi:1-acyl-sn-glycerol-3-phosphate acyltransferase
MGIKFNWVAKHTLFKWPLGAFFRAIGGVAVDRSAGASFLMKTIELYEQRSHLILAIAPEGTRGKTAHWKTGFYTIAERAGVPIALGFIDYQKKCVGITKILTPTGDIDKDFDIIREFYRNRSGKFPDKQGAIQIKQRKKEG